MEKEISFTVLENGLDFIYSALNYIKGDPQKKDLKYAVLHLSAGVELVFKEKLRQTHWSFVFDNIDKANLNSYNTGDFNSVNLDKSIQRLIELCNVSINDEQKRILSKLRKSRNQLEHFAIVDSPIALKASSAGVLSFIVDFITNEFDKKIQNPTEIELINAIQALLPEFDHFVKTRMSEILDRISKFDNPVVECPRCTQKALAIDDGTSCFFCGYSADGESSVKDYIESLYGITWKYIADGGDYPIYSCPECGDETLLDRKSLVGEELVRFICFSCGNTWEWGYMDFCARCGTPTSCNPEDGFALCHSCEERD